MHAIGARIILTPDFFSKKVRLGKYRMSHPRNKRAAILEAAHKRFARYGLAKVTMDEIAADLGMSKAALYYYFQTKEDVFRHVIASEQAEFAHRIASIVDGNLPASSKLSDYFTHHLDLLGSLLDLSILEARAADAVKPIVRDVFREFGSTETGFLVRIISRGKENESSLLIWRTGRRSLFSMCCRGCAYGSSRPCTTAIPNQAMPRRIATK